MRVTSENILILTSAVPNSLRRASSYGLSRSEDGEIHMNAASAASGTIVSLIA